MRRTCRHGLPMIPTPSRRRVGLDGPGHVSHLRAAERLAPRLGRRWTCLRRQVDGRQNVRPASSNEACVSNGPSCSSRPGRATTRRSPSCTSRARTIRSFESSFALYRHEDHSLAAHAEYLHERRQCRIGSLSEPLRTPSQLAIQTGRECVDLALLANTGADLDQASFTLGLRGQDGAGQAGPRSEQGSTRPRPTGPVRQPCHHRTFGHGRLSPQRAVGRRARRPVVIGVERGRAAAAYAAELSPGRACSWTSRMLDARSVSASRGHGSGCRLLQDQVSNANALSGG